MTHTFPELEAVRVSVGAEARQRHLAAIDDALRAPVPRRRRFRLLAVAVAMVLLLPVIALAADRAAPGDLLYPIRQILQGSPQPGSDADQIPSGPTHDADRATTLSSTVVPIQPEPGMSDRRDFTDGRDRTTDHLQDDGVDRTPAEGLDPHPPPEDPPPRDRSSSGATEDDGGDDGNDAVDPDRSRSTGGG